MKNISLVHFTAPPIVAGVELVIKDQAILLFKDGYKVKIIAGSGKKFSPGIEMEIIPEIDSRNPIYLKMRAALDKGEIPKELNEYAEKIYKKLAESLKESDTLIIHQALTMHFNFGLTLALEKFIKKHPRMKFIHWTHDGTFLDPNYLKLYQQFKTKFPWSYLCHPMPDVKYVSISIDRANQIAKLFNKDSSEIEVIPNGILLSSFWNLSEQVQNLTEELNLLDRDLVALLPMRIVRRKNIEQAIEISNALNKKLDFVLLITAPIDYQNPEAFLYFKQLKERVKNLKLEQKVIFLSEYTLKNGQKFDLENLKLSELFLLSDFLLVTSRLEGFGMPLIEAAAMKTPIVCSKIEPFLEIGDDLVCYFNFIESPPNIADRIFKFLEKNLQSKLYRKILKEYSLEKIYQEKIKPLLK